MKKKALRTFVQKIVKKRLHGKSLSSDFYEKEGPSHIRAFCESMRSMAFLLLIFISTFSASFSSMAILTIALIFFLALKKGYRSWLRLLRLHNIIEAEKWEIEHHRNREQKELEIMYSAKGFSGTLLHDVVAHLMSDDNRLLQVMLEEEMGITLESYEHPAKEALYAFFGAFLASLLIFALRPFISCYITIAIVLFTSILLMNRYQKHLLFPLITWNVTIAAFLFAIIYFLHRIL
ncbi:MAG: VIT1/CCC1 transporter family protein [Parachlamydiales bacterium]|nr:VIT1/CCC1 transporter family protein [Parachlamydiales bacterium]